MAGMELSLPALCFAVAAHLVSTVWWAATITRRVEHIERWIVSHEHTAERLAALEQRLESIREGVARIEGFIRSRERGA